MNYEEKYKQALERAKYALTTDMDNSGHWAVNYIFPELKMSDYERMRQAIIESLPKRGYLPQTNIKSKDAIAWLEKQGVQKSIWKPTEAQLIVIKDLIEDKNTSKVNKVILQDMFNELKECYNIFIDNDYPV